MLQLDKVDSFLASSSDRAEKKIKLYTGKVETAMAELLSMTPCPIPLNATDVSTFLDEKRLSDMIDTAEGKSKELGLAANMLDLALCPFEREHYIQQMRGAGLVCVTRTCKAKRAGLFGGEEIPKMITLVTAPKDRLEFEAENTLKMKKRVQSSECPLPSVSSFPETRN